MARPRTSRRCDICDENVAPSVAQRHAQTHRVCGICGPWRTFSGHNDQCPTCGLDEIEVAYRARILADSTAVYVEEAQAFRANRLAKRVA